MTSDFQRALVDDAAVDGVRQHCGHDAALAFARDLWKLRRVPRSGGLMDRLPKWLLICAALLVGITEASLRVPDLLLIYPRYLQGKAQSELVQALSRAATSSPDSPPCHIE
jgi:hypothetical protein